MATSVKHFNSYFFSPFRENLLEQREYDFDWKFFLPRYLFSVPPMMLSSKIVGLSIIKLKNKKKKDEEFVPTDMWLFTSARRHKTQLYFAPINPLTPQVLEKIYEDYQHDSSLLNPLTTQSKEIKNPMIHAGCGVCRNFHGEVYGENLLVCAIHPYSQKKCLDYDCPDYLQEQLDEKRNIIRLEIDFSTTINEAFEKASFLSKKYHLLVSFTFNENENYIVKESDNIKELLRKFYEVKTSNFNYNQ